MLPFLLPHQYALLDNSTAVNLAPYNISMTAQGFKVGVTGTSSNCASARAACKLLQMCPEPPQSVRVTD